MRSLFLEDDSVCSYDGANSNKAILDTIPSHSTSVSIIPWNETQFHFTIVGDNDPIWRNARHGLLDVNAGEDLAADCSAIDFSDWN